MHWLSGGPRVGVLVLEARFERLLQRPEALFARETERLTALEHRFADAQSSRAAGGVRPSSSDAHILVDAVLGVRPSVPPQLHAERVENRAEPTLRLRAAELAGAVVRRSSATGLAAR